MAKRGGRRFVVLAALACAGCGGEPALTLEEWTSRLRSLAFRSAVPITETTREQYAADAEARAAEISDEELTEFAETWGRLGFFPRETPLRPTIAGSSSDWVGAFYSLEDKRITVIGTPGESLLVHELTHALQDQHFDLAAFSREATRDARLARRAVAEGDAMLVQGRYVFVRRGLDLQDAEWSIVFGNQRGFSDQQLGDTKYPALFRAYPAFAYAYGLEYCVWSLTGATLRSPSPTRMPPYDWRRVDALFARPPSSTQEVLHPEHRDEVVAVGLTSVPAALAPRLEAIEWDTLGEWYLRLLLLPLGDGDNAERAAAWDGDRVLFVRDAATKRYGAVWTSAWDTAESAERVRSALARLYRATTFAPPLLQTADGDLLHLERRQDRVVVVKNVARDLFAPLVAAAFEGDGAGSGQRVARPARRVALLLEERLP